MIESEVARGVHLVEASDEDFAAMLEGGRPIRPGLASAPGGVDRPVVLRHVREMAAAPRRAGFPGFHWMIVVNAEVVGLCGFKAPPTALGEVELGYGVAASRRRCGYATAAISALIDVARNQACLRSIVAATAEHNIPSQKVLRRNGFERFARRLDPEDGEMLVWWREQILPTSLP